MLQFPSRHSVRLQLPFLNVARGISLISCAFGLLSSTYPATCRDALLATSLVESLLLVWIHFPVHSHTSMSRWLWLVHNKLAFWTVIAIISVTERTVMVMFLLQVTGAHRSKLPFTEAVYLEILRISDSSHSTAFHTAITDGMTLRGYDIPK